LQPFQVPPSGDRRRLTCSVACSSLRTLSAHARPGLKQDILTYLRQHRLTLSAFARAAGISPGVLQEWFRQRDRALHRADVERLAVALGLESVEAAIQAAGGQTAEQRQAAAATVASQAAAQARRDASRVPSVAPRPRGKWRLGEETRAKMRAAWKGSEAAKANGRRLKAWHRLDTGEPKVEAVLLQHLWSFLGRHPSPTREEIAQLEAAVAARRGVKPEVVHAVYRPYLQKRGLWPKGGRPRNADRGVLIDALRAEWSRDHPRKRNGALADEGWAWVTERVNAAEGRDGSEPGKRWQPLTPFAIRQWVNQQPKAPRTRRPQASDT
jgi:hypothetical protein